MDPQICPPKTTRPHETVTKNRSDGTYFNKLLDQMKDWPITITPAVNGKEVFDFSQEIHAVLDSAGFFPEPHAVGATYPLEMRYGLALLYDENADAGPVEALQRAFRAGGLKAVVVPSKAQPAPVIVPFTHLSKHPSIVIYVGPRSFQPEE